MTRYIQSFPTSGTEQTAIDNEALGKPYVAFIRDGQYIDWNSLEPAPPVPPEPIYSAMPLTFEILSAGTIAWYRTGGQLISTIQYKLNDGNWTNIVSTTGDPSSTLNVVAGDIVQFRGNNNNYGSDVAKWSSLGWNSTAGYNVYGNIMSLIISTGFETATTLTQPYTFRYLFAKQNGTGGIYDASNLILPATTLTDYCYSYMFQGNSHMIKSPELPATTLGDHSYEYLFTSCSALNNIKCLATTNISTTMQRFWVYGLPSAGTFIKNRNATWTRDNNSGIPKGWTVIDAEL